MIQFGLINFLTSGLANGVQAYGMHAPEKAKMPYITTEQDSAFRQRQFSATEAVETALIEDDFEISAWADDQITADVLAKEALTLLENYRGNMVDLDSPNITHHVADVKITSEIQGFDQKIGGYSHSIFISITYH